MMFSCCHPRLPEEAQVALILNILCGFGAQRDRQRVPRGRAAIEKRIARGKKVLAGVAAAVRLSPTRDFTARLSAVRRALYLLFNEGYHGASGEPPCARAVRRGDAPARPCSREHPPAATPETHALAALMCLHAGAPARAARRGGRLQPFAEQDRSRWDAPLVAQGLALLERSAQGES